MNKKVQDMVVSSMNTLFHQRGMNIRCKDVNDCAAMRYLLYSTSPMHREAQHLTFRISEIGKNKKLEVIASRELFMDTLSSVFILGKYVILGNMENQTLNNRPFKVLRVSVDTEELLIDVTPDDNAPEHVRQAWVPTSAVINLCFNKAVLYHINYINTLFGKSNGNASGNDIVSALGMRSHDFYVLPEPRYFSNSEYGNWGGNVVLLTKFLNDHKKEGYPFVFEQGFVVDLQQGAHDDLFQVIPFTFLLRDKHNGIIVPYYEGSPSQVRFTLCGVYFRAVRFDTVDSYVRTAQALHMFLDEGGRLPPRFGSKQLEAHEFIGLQALKFIQSSQQPSSEKDRWLLKKFTEIPYVLSLPIMDSLVASGPKETQHRTNRKAQNDMVKDRRVLELTHSGLSLSPKLLISIYDYYSASDASTELCFQDGKCGVVCDGCNMRMTEQESKTCKQCGSVHYCSRACQVWHWPHHKACCESPEQRAIRLENLEKARLKREEELRRHDERISREREEKASNEKKRKERILQERTLTKIKLEEEIAKRDAMMAVPTPSRAKNKSRSATRSVEEEMIHTLWISDPERRARAEAGMEKQKKQHALAKERKAKEKEERFKQLEKEAAAEYEAATHVVPPVPTLSAFVE